MGKPTLRPHLTPRQKEYLRTFCNNVIITSLVLLAAVVVLALIFLPMTLYQYGYIGGWTVASIYVVMVVLGVAALFTVGKMENW